MVCDESYTIIGNSLLVLVVKYFNLRPNKIHGGGFHCPLNSCAGLCPPQYNRRVRNERHSAWYSHAPLPPLEYGKCPLNIGFFPIRALLYSRCAGRLQRMPHQPTPDPSRGRSDSTSFRLGLPRGLGLSLAPPRPPCRAGPGGGRASLLGLGRP